MQSIKKWDDFGSEEILPFHSAVGELLFYNHRNAWTETQRREIILRLYRGFVMHTDKFYYKRINLVKDTLNNIDNGIDLNEEN